jgi:hypothetical protein
MTGKLPMAKAHKKVNHPWVQAAVLCNQVVEDKTGSFSLIRIVDKYTLTRPPDWDGKTHLEIRLTTFIAFKSGDVKGKRTVRLYHSTPRGKKKKLFESEIEFLGGHYSTNIAIHITFGFKTEGTHWIDVYVQNWLATRMPVTVEFVPAPEGQEERDSGGV